MPGWMITVPLLILVALVVWALIAPDHEWEMERDAREQEAGRDD